MTLTTIPTYDVIKSGVQTITITAGKSLKIETSPEGEEILNAECPAGKVWEACVRVDIQEKDA